MTRLLSIVQAPGVNADSPQLHANRTGGVIRVDSGPPQTKGLPHSNAIRHGQHVGGSLADHCPQGYYSSALWTSSLGGSGHQAHQPACMPCHTSFRWGKRACFGRQSTVHAATTVRSQSIGTFFVTLACVNSWDLARLLTSMPTHTNATTIGLCHVGGARTLPDQRLPHSNDV